MTNSVRITLPLIVLFVFVSSVVPAATGVQCTVDNVGVQTLTYNAQNYLQSPAVTGNNIVAAAVFRAPDSTEKPYGWLANTLDHDAFQLPSAVRSTGASPAYFQHVYRSGQSDSLTVRWTYTPTSTSTLKVDLSITNNDPTDTLARIGTSFLSSYLQLPGPALQYNQNVPIALGPLEQNGGYPVAFLSGTWGSVAYWMGDYSGTANVETNYSSSGQTQFGIGFSNASTNQMGHFYEDPIAPGGTKQYTLYLRFGSATATATALAPEAFTLMRQAYPYLVNWPDRRPVARWVMAEGTQASAINPRGYLWDPTIDVSNQTAFSTLMLSKTDDIIARLEAMNPKPQGIMVWDLEGQEFGQPFTYIGTPSKLHDLAPEMDAVADQIFAKFTAAGFKIGMTLRPMTFMTGTTLPATGHNDSDIYLDDVFVKLDAPWPYRGYLCTAPDTWTQPGARGPWQQTVLNDDAAILAIMEAKVSYAHTRWGARIFYVDSTVYSHGAPFNFQIFRQLQQDFADCLFFPENETLDYWGASAPYNQANMGAFDTWQSVKDLYPQAFSMLQAIDGVDYANATTYSTMVTSVRNGNILFVDGWWDNPQNAHILQVYRDASATGGTGATAGGTSSANPNGRSHCGFGGIMATLAVLSLWIGTVRWRRSP